MTVGELADRAEGLTRFVIGAEGVLPTARLARARALAKRAGDRLRLSGEHTVVALAGATGSGKSSLFNALARMELSTVGVRRPTTAHAFACVWGPSGAGPLLDWLQVADERRFTRESALDGDDELGLRGLVLLDLPDFDSLVAEHQVEDDRLRDHVALVVWVTDPQKYADQILHDQYLRAFRQHRDVTMVVLNQADRLSLDDTRRCVADLSGLIAADGLPDVPVLAVSATAEPGCAVLRAALERTVAARQAALQRLAGDLDEVAGDLSDVVGDPVTPESIDRDQVALVADALAAAVGVPPLTGAVEDRYRARARWALWRVWGEPRHDPVAEVLAAEPGAGQEAALRAAVRTFTDPLVDRLPAPWSAALAEAAHTSLTDLSGRLHAAVAGAAQEPPSPVPWQLLGLLRWLALLAGLGGLGWLVTGGPAISAGLAAGGLVAWLVIGLAAGPFITAGARAARRHAERGLRTAVTTITREYLVTPVVKVLQRYGQAREALRAAGA
jgi:GTP-binding protein EngB required for normal cell division